MLHAQVDRLFRAIDALLATLLLAMVLMVFGNVVLRYAFNSGIVVSEELSRFCFVWLTFIGAIAVMRDNAHLGMDSLIEVMAIGSARFGIGDEPGFLCILSSRFHFDAQLLKPIQDALLSAHC